MSDTPDLPADRFVFTYTETELLALYRLADERTRQRASMDAFWGTLAILEFGPGFAVLGADYAGWVEPAAMRGVLFTAYVAFTAGIIAYGIAIALWQRHLVRIIVRAVSSEQRTCEMSFDASGMRFADNDVDSRVFWHAIDAAEEHNTMAVFWIEKIRPIGIPARAFRDDRARAGLLAAAAARIGKPKG